MRDNENPYSLSSGHSITLKPCRGANGMPNSNRHDMDHRPSLLTACKLQIIYYPEAHARRHGRVNVVGFMEIKTMKTRFDAPMIFQCNLY